MRPNPKSLLDHREFPVLCVDDEPENLRIFELTFQREFSVLTAESGEEGIRLLHENPVAVVLADHRMPGGMTGVDFLARVREIDEKTLRVLVTAYGDVDTLGAAINDGRIYRYHPKPWDPEEMRVTIRRAIEVYALDRERDQLLHEMTLLNQLSRSLYSELDLERLLRLLLRTTTRDLDFNGAAVLLFDEKGERFAWRGFAPDDEVAERLREIPISSTTAPEFVRRACKGETQALFQSQHEHLEAPIREWATEVSGDELVAVPIVGRKGLLGLLCVDNRRGGQRFSVDERTLLDGLSIQAAIAIENAYLVQELRRSREQVRRSDRLGTLGTLAAGLAHEINNPLTSIHTFLSLAPEKRAQSDDEFWTEYHELASSELERIRGLVATMSRLGRGDVREAPPQRVDLSQFAAEVVTLLEREAQAMNVQLSLESDPETPHVRGIRDHLHQVFLNLVLNALDATDEGGRVQIVVGPDPSDPEQAACVRVEDSGRGIPEEHLERIFDPFFTTKDPDQGTGLGLMISHQIVADHGGTIEVQSRMGEGTTFVVRLPAQGAAGSEATEVRP